MKKYFLCILLLLSSCVNIESNVQSFSSQDTINLDDKIYIMPYKFQNKSYNLTMIDENKLISLVKNKIIKKGYTIINDSKQATVVAIVGFNNGHDISFDTSNMKNIGISSDRFKTTNVFYVQHEETKYQNRLPFSRSAIFIAFRQENGSPKIIYKSTIKSNDSCDMLSHIVSYLVSELLFDFPYSRPNEIKYISNKNC